ncbi:hypothetical protein [Prescottella agglutinans]|uniref:Uncharacterized protein n=1 Tax=Prescottella agglutinans TaxID=1644129 RepID=A0ABT6MFW1_9NOCA|nr:hypothetical protein [Prescottella agglutinans]MDH6283215.1 hypothetical protein [Prescottella agglutinans]
MTRQDLESEIISTLSSLRIARVLYEHTDLFADHSDERQMAHLERLRQQVDRVNDRLNEQLDYLSRM